MLIAITNNQIPILKAAVGRLDSSAGEGACLQSQQPEFNPREPRGGKKELPPSSPLPPHT